MRGVDFRGVAALVSLAGVVWLTTETRGGGMTHELLDTIYGQTVFDSFGVSIGGAGDVNNDGYNDLIVGIPADTTNGFESGAAIVFSGLDGSTLHTFFGVDASESYGHAVAGAGDVNNDGYDDFVVAAAYDDVNGFNSGSVYVYSGVDGSTLWTFRGDGPFHIFGYSVSGTGDVNNDGHDDVLIGILFDDSTGADRGGARVMSGLNGSLLHKFDGDDLNDEFGWSVSGAGDVNNDGHDDVIVGARADDDNGTTSGSARVISGADGSTLYTFYGDDAFNQFGYAVGGAGDVNNDGHDDLIVGAPLDDDNGTNSGSARVLSGFDGSILHTFYGDDEDDEFGAAVTGIGDINGDGRDDLIVGATMDDGAALDSGFVRLFSGLDGSVLSTFQGEGTRDYLGTSVAAIGDVNADGIPDFAAGTDFGGADGVGYVKIYASLPTPCAFADVTTAGQCELGSFDGAIDLSDFACYISEWALGTPFSDITLDGTCDPLVGGGDGTNLSDFACYLAEWSLGCP